MCTFQVAGRFLLLWGSARDPQKFNCSGDGWYEQKTQKAVRGSNRDAMRAEGQHGRDGHSRFGALQEQGSTGS